MIGVPYFWTSGRKCNFDGCDKPEFFPKNINGWVLSANQVKMGPTNGGQFHDWSHTGGAVLYIQIFSSNIFTNFRAGQRQPDNREQVQQGGNN